MYSQNGCDWPIVSLRYYIVYTSKLQRWYASFKHYCLLQAHITGLPAEVMATPFGKTILLALQPALQARLGSVTSLGFGDMPPASASSPTPKAPASTPTPPSPSQSSQQAPEAAPTAVPCSSDRSQVANAAEGRAAAQKAEFEAMVRGEFAKVLAEGMLDGNAAGIEALRRVQSSLKTLS